MHFSTTLIGALSLIGQTQACLSLHWYSSSEASGTSCVMQLWDKPEGEEERKVWKEAKCDAPFFMDDEDHNCYEDDIYKACVTRNGKKGTVWNKVHNYEKKLDLINFEVGQACCLWGLGGDSGSCRTRCSEFESCLNDGWNCGACELCDFRGTCDSHYKLRRRELPQSPAGQRNDQIARIAKREETARRAQDEYIAVHGEEAFEAMVEKLRREPPPGMEFLD